MIILLHAYSRKNKGDGLLVDSSLALIKDALGAEMPVTVVSTDADSFSDLPFVRQIPGPAGRTKKEKIAGVLKNVSVMAQGAITGRMNLLDLNDLLPQTKAIMGVGGAYLRGQHTRETLVTSAVHLPQLIWASQAGKPTIYLPQSIGPFSAPWSRLYRHYLAKLDALFVRDDRTYQELGCPANAIRCPDLAVLHLARHLPAEIPSRRYDKVYLVARDLPRTPAVRADYIQRLQELRRLVPEAEPIVQSRGRGNDDQAFYQSLGWGDCRDVPAALSQSGPGIMVSVRLHGALQAMIGGCPTIHLTYERKGFGAYDDLGIRPWLHTAGSFDPRIVAAQIRELQQGSDFWERVAQKSSDIKRSYDVLKQTVQRYAG